MSTTTLNLPYKRFVAQVSTGEPRPKSTYLALMAENLEALKACPWREAADVPVALADHDFTRASHFTDACDAFKMTGAWDASAQKETAFAGMAAYRFTLPQGAASVPVASVALPVSRDRFLKGGVRIALELTDRATPSKDWETVRGAGASAFLANTAANLVATKPAEGTVEVTAEAVPALAETGLAYLWAYVTLEDYTDWWAMYSATEARQYAIEGSARLVGEAATVTFAGEVTPDGDGVVLLAGGSSPTWLQPLPTVNVGASAPEVPAEPLVEDFFAERTATGVKQYSASFRIWLIGFAAPTSITITVSGSGYVVAGCKYGDEDFTLYSRGMTTSRWYINTTVDGRAVAVQFTLATSAPDGNGQATLTYSDVSMVVAGTNGSATSGSLSIAAFARTTYYVMLRLSDGVPSDADLCDAPDESGRRNLEATITGDASPWTVALSGVTYTVVKSGRAVTLKQGTTTLGTWQSAYSGTVSFFDAAVALRLPGEAANDAVRNYGLAAVAGDFSHAVATFEAGTQPPHGELLGRLARMSRGAAGEMLYLHPESGAIADELDALRPVPRFWRAATDPAGQTACQPGLSVWYRRPAASAAAVAFAYRDATVAVTKVTDPAFLQLALLALRAPSAFGARLVLDNAGESAVSNGFVLRFVAWRSPAEQWDGGNGFAMAAMASMPSVYRAEGPESVSWSVDCTGALLRFGVRAMTADRVGVSQAVTGDIAAGAEIAIPLVAPVGAGDVVLVAPEVLGFADGAGAASVYFGRQADPAAAGAAQGWARYPHNLGWFPRVTGI